MLVAGIRVGSGVGSGAGAEHAAKNNPVLITCLVYKKEIIFVKFFQRSTLPQTGTNQITVMTLLDAAGILAYMLYNR